MGTGGGVVEGVRAGSNRSGGSRAAPGGGVTWGDGGMLKAGRWEGGGMGLAMGGSVVGAIRLYELVGS